MAGNPNYRCDDCRDEPNRCTDCRARRAQVRRRLRAEKRQHGICTECHRRALLDRKTGQRYSRCRRHMTDNARISGQSHARARQQANA